jgi:predicted metal-dependent hydrolase
MLDLLRWHGAEEVEHRAVAFDLLRHLDPGYARRIRALMFGIPALLWLWIRGARFLTAADPTLGPTAKVTPIVKQGVTWRGYAAGARRGILPPPLSAARSAARFLRRDYHPSQEASTRQAVGYLGSSPAARAAAR